MALAVDQHPVRALGPRGPDPAFCITVRPRRLRWSLHHPDALAGGDLIERGRELGVAVPDEEPELADPVGESHDQIADLLGGPGDVRVRRHPGDVHAPGRYLHHEQHMQPFEEDRVHGDEITRQQALAWARRNLRQEVSSPRGAGR
jgi:hypothetical protein